MNIVLTVAFYNSWVSHIYIHARVQGSPAELPRFYVVVRLALTLYCHRQADSGDLFIIQFSFMSANCYQQVL